MKKGFTLIEVIIAIGIFGLGVLALLGYMAFSTQFVRYSRQTTIASNLAQEIVEQTISQAYTSLVPGTGTKTNFSLDSTNDYYPYQYQLNIGLVNSSLNASQADVGLKKVEVIIYWQGFGGEKSIQMSTIVSRK